MHCFNHSNVHSIGFCKNCARGLCKDCFHLSAGVLSCRGCSKKVNQMEEYLERMIYKGEIGSSSHVFLAMIAQILMAIVFIGLGAYYSTHFLSLEAILVGIPMMLCGGLLFLNGIRMLWNNYIKKS